MKRTLLAFIALSYCVAGYSQTITDGLMMPKGALCTGFMYGHDQWTNYWEGTRKRDNENVGTVSTNSLMWVGNYGINSKVNVIAMVPYVWTKATGGTMTGMEGLQDITLAAKYNALKADFKTSTFKAFGVFALSTPLSDYTPDFLPLSIGMASTNLSFRLTANYKLNAGWYFNASGAYTWRSNVYLDRAVYYTDGRMFMTNEVQMPNVIDYVLNAGYHKGAFQGELNIIQQYTLDGGDIRRQDMPFVSNQMNFIKTGGTLMFYVPQPKGLAVRASGSITLAGRNVGQSTTVSGGLLYTIRFIKPE